jgi:diacylglycerol kinase (ATP)
VTAFAVYNPTADRGRVGRNWPALFAALRTVFPGLTAMASGGRGQTARLVRDGLREGHLEIVAVGGDGTVNEAVNGFFEQGVPVSPDAVLSVVPMGRGDIGRGQADKAAGGVAAALRLRQARVRTVDLGHVSCLARDGGAAARFFLNAASFGLTGDIARRLGRSRFLQLRELQETLALAAWRRCQVRLMAGADEIDGIAAVAVMNGRSFGGGLVAAPDADPADGLFDIAVLAGAPRRRIGTMLRQLRGLEAVPELRRLRAPRLAAAPTLETGRPVWVETDGEAVGVLPASFELLPQALRLRL